MNNSIDSNNVLSALRQRIAPYEVRRQLCVAGVVSLGHAGIDDALRGGLERGKLHEIFAAEVGDTSSATGFTSMLATRVAAQDGNIIWLRQAEAQRHSGRIYVSGLVELGVDPTRLLMGLMPDPLSLLRVAVEVVRCPAVAVAVIELWRMPRQLDLTASRRLAVAAEHSGVTTLMLRQDAEPTPSAAQTRWAVASTAATPLAANAPGRPTLDIHLLRQRGGRSGLRWQVEWDREQGIFRNPALSGALVSSAEWGPVAATG